MLPDLLCPEEQANWMQDGGPEAAGPARHVHEPHTHGRSSGAW